MPTGGWIKLRVLGVTEAESNWVEPAARGRRGPTVASEISAPPRQGKSWSRPWVGGGDQGDLSWSLFFFFFCGAERARKIREPAAVRIHERGPGPGRRYFFHLAQMGRCIVSS